MNKPLLAVPIQTSDLKIIESTLKNKKSRFDVLEIWIDQLKKKDLSPERIEELCGQWRSMGDKKLLIACKDKSERGKFRGKPAQKVELLMAAARGGAHFVDIGLQIGNAAILKLVEHNKRSKVIVSFHDFEKTPNIKRLHTIAQKMKDAGADIVKLATMVHHPQDNEVLMEFALDLKKEHQKHVVIGMGQLGIMTRVFSRPMGNEINFVTLDKQTAPGQLNLDQMLKFQEVFRF